MLLGIGWFVLVLKRQKKWMDGALTHIYAHFIEYRLMTYKRCDDDPCQLHVFAGLIQVKLYDVIKVNQDTPYIDTLSVSDFVVIMMNNASKRSFSRGKKMLLMDARYLMLNRKTSYLTFENPLWLCRSIGCRLAVCCKKLKRRLEFHCTTEVSGDSAHIVE